MTYKQSAPQQSVPDHTFPLAESERGTWPIFKLLRPYLGHLVLLALVSIGLSFLTGATRVALTPLLEIVLNSSASELVVDNASDAQPLTFDLNHLGLWLLNLTARATGWADPWHLLLVTSGIYLALTLIGVVASFGTRYFAEVIRFQVARDLGHKLFNHILRLPLSFLNRHQTGWLQSRMTTDPRYAVNTLNGLIIDGLSNSLLSVFYAFLLVRTDTRLAIVAAVAGLVHVGLSRSLAGTLKERIRADLGSSAQTQATTQERLMAVREVKVLAGEEYEQTSFWELLTSQLRATMRHTMFKSVEIPVRESINQVVLVAVMLFGAWELLNGHLTTSAFLLFMFFAQSLISPLAKLAGVFLQAESIRTSLEGVVYILSQEQESSGGHPMPPSGLHETLVLRDVSFAYEDLPVLRDINLTIKKGEMVALVGRSGAGKTTLVDLLLRFYEPSAGSIELDGVPIGEFDLSQYRRLFGMVPQDTLLFADTVYNNIAYARPELTREEVEQAARVANAEGFILNELPEGYDTIVGERGVMLSGGQRQRIAIARAVAHRPAILVLDEATSSLDTEAERLVQDAIARVVKGYTAIVIAHRLSTVRMANKIVVLEEGQIVEMGTHDELLAQNGEYRYLYDLQFRAHEATDETEA